MNHFLNILRYAKPYKRFAIGHIISNVFFALFGTLSFVALKPMLDVIFKLDKPIPSEKPTWSGLMEIGDFAENYLAYLMNQFTGGDNSKALVFVVALVIVMFLLKNIAGYLANYF